MTMQDGMFVAPEGLVLIDGFKVDLGGGMSFAAVETEEPMQPAFFVTLTGRVNKSEERKELHLMFGAQFGYELGDEIMTRLEQFMAEVKRQLPDDPN